MNQVSPKKRKINHQSTKQDGTLLERASNLPTHDHDLLALEVEELLSKIRPRAVRRLEKIDVVLRGLKDIIESIEAHAPLTVRFALNTIGGIPADNTSYMRQKNV